MSIQPKLLHHGEHVSSLYAVEPGVKAPSTADERRIQGQGGIVQRYEKRESVHRNPQALGWIKATYQDAIEYTSKTKDLRGLAFFWAVFSGPSLVAVSVLFMYGAFQFDDWFTWMLFPPGAVIFFCMGTWLGALMLRADLFHLSDQPIIFDRKHRKVYRLFNEMPSGLLGIFKPWPVHACAYDWDLIDAEHNAEGVITGATATTNHFLMFAVRKSASDPTIIDSFQIANAMSLSDGLTDAMWEHIRRFMEEGGPHLPTPNEPLASQEKPPTWWQSLGASGCFGPGYFRRWRSLPGFMILMHMVLPLSVPMYLLWGTGNWLSYKTEIKIGWPGEVLAAVGPVRRDAGTGIQS